MKFTALGSTFHSTHPGRHHGPTAESSPPLIAPRVLVFRVQELEIRAGDRGAAVENRRVRHSGSQQRQIIHPGQQGETRRAKASFLHELESRGPV